MNNEHHLLGWYSIRVGKKHNSTALIAEGKHLQSDAYSTVGLLLGLALLADVAETMNAQRGEDWIDIHNAKILKSGSFLNIDCDLTLPWFYTIEQGHQLSDDLRDIFRAKFPDRVRMTVHVDPCNVSDKVKCHKCALSSCPYRKQPFLATEPITASAFVHEENEQRMNPKYGKK